MVSSSSFENLRRDGHVHAQSNGYCLNLRSRGGLAGRRQELCVFFSVRVNRVLKVVAAGEHGPNGMMLCPRGLSAESSENIRAGLEERVVCLHCTVS